MKIFFFLLVFFAAANTLSAASLPAEGFNAPTGLLLAADGSLYVSEWGANRISVMDASGSRRALDVSISAPAGLAQDSQGNIYIAGYGDGSIYIWDGKAAPRLWASGFQQPTGLLWSDSGLLVANRGAGTVEEVDAKGQRRVLSSGHNLPVGLAKTASGALYVSCYGGSLDRVGQNGVAQKIYAGLGRPGVGMAPAGKDSVFVVDNGAGAVVEAGAKGALRTLAKNLRSPVGLAKTADNKIIVATWGDGKIQLVEDGK